VTLQQNGNQRPSASFTNVIFPSPLKSMRIKSPSFTCPTPHLCVLLAMLTAPLSCCDNPHCADVHRARVQSSQAYNTNIRQHSVRCARMAAVTLEVSSL